MQKYLNQFIDRELKEKIQGEPSSLSIFNSSNKLFTVKWLYKSEIKKHIFKPFEEMTKNDGWYSQTMYDRYNECFNFFQDDTQSFAKKYHLDVHEEVRYKNFDKNEIIKVLNNPNTLIKIRLWRTSVGDIYFYDPDYQYFITLEFQPSH